MNRMLPLLAPAGLLALSILVTGCPDFDKKAAENTRPIVSAGDDQTVDSGELVTLTATGTDADSDELTFFWRQIAGPGVSLSATTEREVTFTAPTENISLVFEVRASDDFDESPPDLVQVNVSFNRRPVASVSPSWSTPNGTSLRLRGDGSDPDGDEIVSYLWTAISGPAGADLSTVLAEANTRLPTFTSTLKGDYWVELIVGDGETMSEPVETVVVAENRAPVAEGSATATLLDPRIFDLDASPSTDPDGDTITSWRWRIASTPSNANATITGATDQQTTTVEVLGSGSFEVELVVTDDEGVESDPATVRLFANSAPILSLNGLIFAAGTGTAFPVDASASADPDGDPLVITWTRTSGSALFQDQAAGAMPTILAPSFSALLAAGESTGATYEVVATDGVFDSTPQIVSLYAGPGIANYVLVSASPAADDLGPCGSVAQPCATLGRGLEIITGGGASGDGRTLLLTTGAFTDTTPQERIWPASVDVHGGFDPVTFAPTSALSEIVFDQTAPACNNNTWGVRLPTGSAVEFRQIDASHTLPCTNTARLFLCDGCEATFVDSAAGIDLQAFGTYVFVVMGGGDLLLDRTEIRTNGGFHTDAVWAGASNVVIRDSSIISNSGVSSGRALEVTSGTVTVERTYLNLVGPNGSNNTTDTILVRDGNLYLRNSVVHHQIGSNTAIEVRAGSATIENSTIIAVASAAGAIRSVPALDLVNSIVDGGALALHLDSVPARQSRLYANAIDSVGPTVVRCRNSADIANLDQTDPTDLSACNDTGTPWTGNLSGPCAFVDEATADFHLETGIANVCLDGGAATSPVGPALPDDLDGEARPQGTGVDIGADEAG